MAHCPFPREDQLDDELNLEKLPVLSSTSIAKSVVSHQEHRSNELPGIPLVELDSADITECLEEDLLTPNLNRLAPHLWLVETQDSSHVSPLH